MKYRSVVFLLFIWSCSLAATEDPAAWRTNTNAQRFTAKSVPAEKAIRFDAEFFPAARWNYWMYPKIVFQTPVSGVKRVEFEARTDTPFRWAYWMTGKEKISYQPQKEWRLFRIDLEKNGIHGPLTEMRIGFNPIPEKATLFIRNIRLLGADGNNLPFSVKQQIFSVNKIVHGDPKRPDSVFTVKRPPEFQVDLTSDVSFRVETWNHQSIVSGKIPADGKLQLSNLPYGYYALKLESPNYHFAGQKFFAVLAEPIRMADDSSFALDLAAAYCLPLHLNHMPKAETAYGFVAELSKLAGSPMVRARLSWPSIQKTPGEFDWNTKHGVALQKYREAGLKVCAVFNEAPEFARRDGTNACDEMNAAFQWGRELGSRWKDTISAVEVWNEANLPEFFNGPVWHLATTTKAFYRGFKSTNPTGLVGISSLTTVPDNFLKLLLSSEIANYSDFSNLHNYEPICGYRNNYWNPKYKMERCRLPGHPEWITEFGTDVEGNAILGENKREKRSAEQAEVEVIKEPSPEQEILVAEQVTKSLILAKSLGIDRTFCFCLMPLNERSGRKHWGMLRNDLSAKPSFVSFAVLARQLGRASYEGVYPLADGTEAFLFRQPNGSQTLTAWSKSSVDTKPFSKDGTPVDYDNLHEIAVSVNTSGVVEKVDFLGSVSQLKNQGGRIAFTLNRYPVFLNNLHGLKPVGKVEKNKTITRGDHEQPDLSIVTGVIGLSATPIRSHALIYNKLDFMIEICNYGDEIKYGKLHSDYIEGLPEKLILEPMKKQSIPVRLRPREKRCVYDLAISGEFNGKKITRLSVPVIRGDLALKNDGYTLQMTPEAWTRNSSGNLQITTTDEPGVLKFTVCFSDDCTDKWCYPGQLLPQELDDVSVLSYEIRMDPKCAKPQWNYAMLVASEDIEKGNDVYVTSRLSADGTWVQNLIPLPFTARELRQIRIGNNPRSKIFTFYLRNVKLLR